MPIAPDPTPASRRDPRSAIVRRVTALVGRRAALVGLTLAVVVAASAPVSAQVAPKQEPVYEPNRSFEDAFDFAQNSYLYGDYGDVVQTLRPILLPAAPADAESATLIRAYTLLGTAAHFETEGATADDAFLQVLLRDPRFQLDPLLYPPRVIERFEAVRDANSERLNALLAEDEVSAIVYVEHQIREQSRLVSMLPFGYGFFASDRDVVGLGYAVSEGALGAAMIGLFLSNEIARGRDGFFAEPERARNRGTAQLITASAFTTLVIANIIHGAVTHEDTRRTEFRVLDEAPPGLEQSSTSRSRPRGWRVSFAPIIQVQ